MECHEGESCGITSYEDAAMALDQGVDALGFNFFPAQPEIYRSGGCALDHPAPSAVCGDGRTLRKCGGAGRSCRRRRVWPECRFCSCMAMKLRSTAGSLADWPLIKAVRIGNDPHPGGSGRYPVQAFLLDVQDDALFGGTGKSFDWSLAREIKSIRPDHPGGRASARQCEGSDPRGDRRMGWMCAAESKARPGKRMPGKLTQFMNEVRNVGRLPSPALMNAGAMVPMGAGLFPRR